MISNIRGVPVLVVATALACSPGPRAEGPAPAENVILVSIDTLRADRLGDYGRDPSFTPNIDAFREDAVLFELTIAQAPSTLSSHASLFTSLIPHHHGASIKGRKRREGTSFAGPARRALAAAPRGPIAGHRRVLATL
jgi:arylsulfatase A-like enzyme